MLFHFLASLGEVTNNIKVSDDKGNKIGLYLLKSIYLKQNKDRVNIPKLIQI